MWKNTLHQPGAQQHNLANSPPSRCLRASLFRPFISAKGRTIPAPHPTPLRPLPAPASPHAGIISATGRTIPASNNQPIPGALQTDADVNSQSLGGALLDSSGRLIGMPVVSYAKPGVARSSGVNFALPADLLRDVVPRLIVYGSAATRR